MSIQLMRQSLRIKRHAIRAREREQFAKKILHQVQKISNVQHAKKMALYLENDGEKVGS